MTEALLAVLHDLCNAAIRHILRRTESIGCDVGSEHKAA
jgi:hypothetical protein